MLKDTVVKNINVSNIDVSNISSFVTDKLDVSFIDISNDALVQGKSINNVIDRFNIIDNAIQDNKIYFKSLLNNNNFELLQENIWYDISFLNYQFSSSTINNLVDSNGLFKIPRDGIYLIEENYFLNYNNVNTLFSKIYTKRDNIEISLNFLQYNHLNNNDNLTLTQSNIYQLKKMFYIHKLNI